MRMTSERKEKNEVRDVGEGRPLSCIQLALVKIAIGWISSHQQVPKEVPVCGDRNCISSFTIYFFWLVQAKKSEKKRQSQKLKDPRPFSKKATLSDNCFISNLYVISRKLHRFVPS